MIDGWMNPLCMQEFMCSCKRWCMGMLESLLLGITTSFLSPFPNQNVIEVVVQIFPIQRSISLSWELNVILIFLFPSFVNSWNDHHSCFQSCPDVKYLTQSLKRYALYLLMPIFLFSFFFFVLSGHLVCTINYVLMQQLFLKNLLAV